MAFAGEENESEPWQHTISVSNPISGLLPESLTLVLANQVFIATQPLANRLAAFQNPEFFRGKASFSSLR